MTMPLVSTRCGSRIHVDSILTRLQCICIWHFRWRSALRALLQTPGLSGFRLALLRLEIHGAWLDWGVVERLYLSGCPDAVDYGGDAEHAESHPEHKTPLQQRGLWVAKKKGWLKTKTQFL